MILSPLAKTTLFLGLEYGLVVETRRPQLWLLSHMVVRSKATEYWIHQQCLCELRISKVATIYGWLKMQGCNRVIMWLFCIDLGGLMIPTVFDAALPMGE